MAWQWWRPWCWYERFICIVCVHIHLAYSFYNVSHFEHNSHTFSQYTKYTSDRSMKMWVCNICANSRSKMHTRKIHGLFHNTKNHTQHTNIRSLSFFLSPVFHWLSFFFSDFVYECVYILLLALIALFQMRCSRGTCLWNLNAVLGDDQWWHWQCFLCQNCK